MTNSLTSGHHGGQEPAAASIAGAGRRGAARWLAVAVVAVATAGSAAGPAASPALADSAVTVTTTSAETTAGDGTCSLAEAILYAQRLNGGNTDCGTTATGTTVINMPEGTYAVPPVPPNSQRPHLEIGSGGPGPIVIAGTTTGTIGTTIDGQGAAGRLLLIDPGATVIIRNVTLRGGVAMSGFGGGINNGGTLTLDHVTVNGNRTATIQLLPSLQVPFPGGGIYNSGTLNLVNAIISGNSTDHGYPGLTLSTSCLDPAAPGTAGGAGGGIYNQGGTVTALNTTIAGNATGAGGHGDTGSSGCGSAGQNGGAGGLGGSGGGIFNNNGIVTLRRSAVYGNTTGNGGHGGLGSAGSHVGGFGGGGAGGGAGAGIYNNGMLTMTDTTITGNAGGNGGVGGPGGQNGSTGTTNTGGGLGQGGPGAGINQENGPASVQESTVTANVDGAGLVGEGAGPSASGIEVVAGELTEIDTIVSKNDCYAFPAGQIKDGLAAGDGHLNLTFPTASCPGIVADPRLGPLQENGGPTPTMAIAPPSPAIDRIPATAAGCTPADQRGIARPQPSGGRCDVGAYEFKP